MEGTASANDAAHGWLTYFPMKNYNHPVPPRWASTLLSWWGDPNTREEVQGDLLELYAHWVQTVGKRRANWRYSLCALKLLRPLAKLANVPEYPSPFLLSPDMLRNYLKIALRNLIKNKAYSAINIGGLALGMAVTLLIGLWINNELTFNHYHKNHDRIAQVYQSQISMRKSVLLILFPGHWK